jgi:inhibitor of cysteine peptidase
LSHALVALAVAGWMLSASATPVEAGAMQTLTEADDGRTIDLTVGDDVRVTLPENATTGYRWEIDRLNAGVVASAGSEPNYPGGAVGAGGKVTFAFKAEKAGSSEVALKYWRHFEGDSSIVRRFRISLVVKP